MPKANKWVKNRKVDKAENSIKFDKMPICLNLIQVLITINETPTPI